MAVVPAAEAEAGIQLEQRTSSVGDDSLRSSSCCVYALRERYDSNASKDAVTSSPKVNVDLVV
jgi:hypothetical protein